MLTGKNLTFLTLPFHVKQRIFAKSLNDMDTETLNIFSNLFANVCFPTAACIALFWFLVKQNKELKNAIDNNTKVLAELKTLLKNEI